ncbi:hypothetical protein, partial [Xanthomonas arboricola]|uniref:hypothetical protein n=1 Tax=Xanthomonas arboricola TaxID=56448 RepID=UPI001C614AD4
MSSWVRGIQSGRADSTGAVVRLRQLVRGLVEISRSVRGSSATGAGAETGAVSGDAALTVAGRGGGEVGAGE